MCGVISTEIGSTGSVGLLLLRASVVSQNGDDSLAQSAPLPSATVGAPSCVNRVAEYRASKKHRKKLRELEKRNRDDSVVQVIG